VFIKDAGTAPKVDPTAYVALGWVAVGNPAQVLPPSEHERIWAIQKLLNFPLTVYGFERILGLYVRFKLRPELDDAEYLRTMAGVLGRTALRVLRVRPGAGLPVRRCGVRWPGAARGRGCSSTDWRSRGLAA
jgi:hypothetical protein